MKLFNLGGIDPNEFAIQVAVRLNTGEMACKSYFFHEGEWHYQFDTVIGQAGPETHGVKTLGHPSVAAQNAFKAVLEAFRLVVDDKELPLLIAEHRTDGEGGLN